MPALVKAQHSDKASVVDLLKDISIKNNRFTFVFNALFVKLEIFFDSYRIVTVLSPNYLYL